MAAPVTLVALLHGPDQRGLVARASGWIFARGGNIIHADQHRDETAGVFFQRVEFDPFTHDLPSSAAWTLVFPCFTSACRGTNNREKGSR